MQIRTRLHGWHRLSIVAYALWMLAAPIILYSDKPGVEVDYGIRFGISAVIGLFLLLTIWISILAIKWIMRGFRQP
jgi:hypothetical protein